MRFVADFYAECGAVDAGFYAEYGSVGAGFYAVCGAVVTGLFNTSYKCHSNLSS